MDLLNKIPGVGHVKAIYHRAVGEDEEADAAWRSANRSTAVLGGMIVAGPVGAVLGGTTVDVVHSMIYGKPIGMAEDFIEICTDLEKDSFPWKGVGKMTVRIAVDAVHGSGMEKGIVRTVMRPCYET